MQRFKAYWQIQHNWQLLFPFLGLLGLIYCSYKITILFTKNFNLILTSTITVIVTYLLLVLVLYIFKKLEKKWILNYKWEMIRVFIVFAVTGSSSVIIGKPIIQLMGITKENLNPILYWILFISIGLIFYQILLVSFGWLFGQFKFFWEFEKKMLRKMGLKKFID
ncbi:hypothetical protein OE09_1666 [Flavobacteriaceae bacterium MAR_2010_72]|nr:hypothetical protein OE09_1666 [Flavobacteriaceae bacterium MAR_2010_72]